MPPVPFSPTSTAALDALAVGKQVADRVPGLCAGVARRGELAWSAGIGTARLDEPGKPPDDGTQYDIASNTKTFVAVTVLALRDEGKLSLDDTVDVHVPESTHAGVTIRELLAHVSGMQREPVGDVWDTLEFPDRTELVAGWNAAQRILPPHNVHHYSNLCYAMLGEIIGRLDGGTWFDSVQRRILDPLELRRTSLGKTGRAAGAYYVPPWTDVPVEEPTLDCLAFAAAGGMSSTLADMATWGGFIANPVAEVLNPDTMEEMCQPVVISQAQWKEAWGLGLILARRDDRTWVGHTGAHPGTISGCFTHRESATTGVVLMNNSAATAPGTFAVDLGSYAVEHEPPVVEPWVPGTAVPPELVPLLGHWFSEGRLFVLTCRQGRLEARVDGQPSWMGPSEFEQVDADTFRTVKGRERGELLRVRRDASGAVTAFNWATYLFTRQPSAFGEWLNA